MPRAPNLTPPSRGRTTLVGAGIGLLVALVLALLRQTGAVEGIEWRLVDARTIHFLGSTKPDPRIVLATISEPDIEALRVHGQEWPWDLDVNSYAYKWMAACGVAGIVVDVYHLDQGAGLGEWTSRPEGQPLAEAVAKEYAEVGRVALAFELTSNVPAREPLRIEAFRQKLSALPPMPVDPAYRRPYVRLPVATLLRGAHRTGFANTETDGDGVTRRSLLFARVASVDPGGKAPPVEGVDSSPAEPTSDDVVVPSLGLAYAMDHAGSVAVAEETVRVGDRKQRLAPGGTFLVNFRGRQDSYASVRPAELVLAGYALSGDPSHEGPKSGPASKEALRGKTVIWGVNVAGIKDVVATPVSEVFPGPEFQATVLDNLLNGDGRVPASRGVDLAISLALAVALGAAGGALTLRGAFLGFALLAAILLGGGSLALFAAGTSIDVFTPLAGLVMTYSGVTAYRLMTEGRRNRWLESTFGQYLSPAVIEELKKDPSRLALGGRITEVTVLFSDIKGFTSIAERLPSPELVRLLNVYLTGQSEQVLVEDGMIDKFIGDAVMALFGDPLPHGDHAVRACRAAIRSLEAIASTTPLVESFQIAPLVNRIGVNTGPAHVGNMGSEKRFDYTAMGDTVNLASRLEGANKEFGTRVLLGPLTHEQAKAEIVSKPVARLRVVGKKEPVAVHELVAMREGAAAELVRHAEAYGRAHAAVLRDDLGAAAAALEEAKSARPDDGLCAWLGGVLERLRAGEIARPWDGVVTLESK